MTTHALAFLNSRKVHVISHKDLHDPATTMIVTVDLTNDPYVYEIGFLDKSTLQVCFVEDFKEPNSWRNLWGWL